MAQFQRHFVQELTKPLIVRQCGDLGFSGDNDSDVISVDLYTDGVAYSGGGTCAGACICPDGSTVALSGSVSGKTASVTLTEDCFAIPGQIGIAIRVTSETTKTTVLKAIYNVDLFATNNPVDPGSRISLDVGDLVNRIDAAVESIPASADQLKAAMAPNFSDTTAYPAGAYVWNNGTLYRFTTAHAAGSWAGTDATAVALGNDVADLKSAIGEDVYVLSDYSTGYYNLGSTITSLDIESAPTTSSGGSNFRCIIVPCSPGDVFKITSTGTAVARNWAFLSSASGANNIISRKTTPYTMSEEIVTAPSGTQYAVFNADSRQTYLIIYGVSVSYKIDTLENSLQNSIDTLENNLQDSIDTLESNVQNSLDNLESGVQNSLNNANIQLNRETITAGNLLSGYWNTTNGKFVSASGWSCTKDLIAVPQDMIGKLFKSLAGVKVNVVCYDANKAYSGTFAAYAGAPVNQVLCMPSGTVYIHMSVHTEVERISISTINGSNKIEYPYNDSWYLYKTNAWCDNTGVVETVDTMDCVCLPNVTAGDKWYTNATNSYVFMPFDNTNTFLGVLTPDQVNKHGRIYTVPANTAYVYCNIPHANTHGNYSTVFYNITNGGKVLAIGDSITWLDGETGGTYDSATLFLGWQKQLERIGFDVTSAGFNGYCYAKAEGVNSIYTKIVEENYDVTGYDYIVLAGGTNDDNNNIDVGTVPNEYQHTYTVAEIGTTAGALGAIISYIRANNATAKIILCTQNKSQANGRPYSEAVQYADMIRQMSKYASCHLCDLFANMNVTPFTSGFTALYYDATHPNKAGMERMGKLVADAVASYE